MNISYMEIGERLRTRRKEMGINQEQAAELLGISTTYYGGIERGVRKLSAQRIMDVYEKMGLDPTYLLTGEISGIRMPDSLSTEMRKRIERIVIEMVELCEKIIEANG